MSRVSREGEGDKGQRGDQASRSSCHQGAALYRVPRQREVSVNFVNSMSDLAFDISSNTTFFIPGDPAAQGRPRTRVLRLGSRSVAQIYNPHNADDWKARVEIIARDYVPRAPLLGPIRLWAIFHVRRPQSHFRRAKERFDLKPDSPVWHTSKPDGDNFAKALLDALTAVRMWADDSQVCDQRIQKVYCTDDKPGCLVTIQQISTLCHNIHSPALDL